MSTPQIPQSNIPGGEISISPSQGTQAFYPSLFQSFLIIFLSEIADRTFILVLIYSMKMHWLPLLLDSLGAMLFMNVLAIAVGYMIPLFLVKGIVDWIGFFCFLGFGIINLKEGYEMDSKTVAEEFNEELNENEHQYSKLRGKEEIEVNKSGKQSQVKSLGALCVELFTFIVLSEFGDLSQIATIAIAAIYNVYGVIIGTSIAYLCAILVAAFIGYTVGKFITEKILFMLII